MVVIVTGASSGIGKAICELLGSKGHIVYGLSRRKAHESSFISMQVDVTKKEDITKAFETIYEKEQAIDAIINNAGMGISGSVEDTELSDAKALFDVNFFGAFEVIQVALPYLREQKKSKIINITSLAGTFPIPFQAFYSASKAALNNFTWALQNEVQPFGISLCALMPGDVKTGFTTHRKKNIKTTIEYGGRVKKSVAVMEIDEQNGMPPLSIAKKVEALLKMKHMPIEVTVGFKYKSLLRIKRFVSATFANKLLGSIYGFFKLK
jgi:short-subunit dehydrogenase